MAAAAAGRRAAPAGLLSAERTGQGSRSELPPVVFSSSKLEAASEARIAPEMCGTSKFSFSHLFLICLVQYWMPGFRQQRFLFASGS